MEAWGQRVSASFLLVPLRQHRNVDLYGRHPWAGGVAVACIAGCVSLRRSVALRGRIALGRSIAVSLGSSHLRPVPVWGRNLRHVQLWLCRGDDAGCKGLRWHIRLGFNHCGGEGLWRKGLRPIHWRGRISIGSERLSGQRRGHRGEGQPERRGQLLTHAVPHEH